ncbi:hypothetical protein Tco_1066475 [Tanacetum coccineum]|uniref:Uncharacterized protein n=1 Tax=Tanacetum coccineum TaxID=301880 RepID=A0ABQ5HC84_9ASTR
MFFPSFTISDIASNRIRTVGCPHLNKILHEVVSVTVWALWKWRNRIVNATPDTVSSIREEDIFPSIQMLSKLWISARLKSHIANCFVLPEEKAEGYHQGKIHQRMYPQRVNSSVSLFSIEPSACILFSELADGSGR